MESPEDQQPSQHSWVNFFDHSYSTKCNNIFRRCFYAITNKKQNVHCLRKISPDITKRKDESSYG